MNRTKFVGVFFLIMFLTSCVSGVYVKPTHEDKKENYTLTVNKSFDEVWNQLIEYSASTFFAIDNYEKDSGLITLSFGSSQPSEFITGGYWEAIGYKGDYVDFSADFNNGRLSGKMNIVVIKVSDNESRVIVNARYVFTTPSHTWSFDTGNCDTIFASSPPMGTGRERTICPTYKAENAILDALK